MNPPDSRIARDTAMNSSEVVALKSDLRARLLAARRAIPDAQRSDAVEKIGSQVIAWVKRNAIKTLAVYSPIRSEPDLTPVWLVLATGGITLALPTVIDNDAPLAFVMWQPAQTMVRDAFGVAIPAPPHRLITPEAMLIPCLGITPQRIRLGYGGGFYDRTLATLPSVLTVGIAFDCCTTDFVAQSHDIALRAVITESGMF